MFVAPGVIDGPGVSIGTVIGGSDAAAVGAVVDAGVATEVG
jgi:hypothetical protein